MSVGLIDMKNFRNINKQDGFNLIEVLLAFLVLSVGLLGVAGMQTTAVKASHTAMLKTVAISKIESISERIRANSSSLLTDYELVFDTEADDENCDERSGTVIECTPAQLASNDLYVWEKSLVNGALPVSGTDASIAIDDTVVPNIVTITIIWKERGEDMTYSTKLQRLPPPAAAAPPLAAP